MRTMIVVFAMLFTVACRHNPVEPEPVPEPVPGPVTGNNTVKIFSITPAEGSMLHYDSSEGQVTVKFTLASDVASDADAVMMRGYLSFITFYYQHTYL